MVHRGGAELDQDFAVPRLRVRGVLIAEHLRAAVLVDADRLHRCKILA
jgi:hypothetical protein